MPCPVSESIKLTALERRMEGWGVRRFHGSTELQEQEKDNYDDGGK